MFGVQGSGDTSGYGGLTRTVEFPAASLPPFGGWWDQVYERIGTAIGDDGLGGAPAAGLAPSLSDVITKVVIHRGEITFHVAREHLAKLARLLRDDAHLRFEFCSSVSGVHYPADQGRELHAVYHLQSMTHNRRIRLEVSAPDSDPHIPSVVGHLPDRRLARARDVRHVRHRLRRSPRPDPHPDARRLARLPAAQGLPARWHPGRVQGRHHRTAGPEEVVLMTTTDTGSTDPYSFGAEPAEGRVYTVTGQDWDGLVSEQAERGDERIVVNMGPQHPSTHGVLRLILEMEGESVTEARCGIGYLHTGIEKNMEFRSWTQGVTFCTRMDYLAPLSQETSYCLGVERLLDIEDQIPEKASVIRVLMLELNRISSHLVCIATGGMEIGALTVMTIGFREREKVLDVFELITGLRMNHAYIRPGGVAQDLPDNALAEVKDLIDWLKKHLPEYAAFCNANPIFKGRLGGVGYLDLAGCMALGISGPHAALDRLRLGSAQEAAVLRLRDLRLRGADLGHRRTRTVASGSG